MSTVHLSWSPIVGFFVVLGIVCLLVLRWSETLRRKIFHLTQIDTQDVLFALIIIAVASIIFFLVFIFGSRRGILGL